MELLLALDPGETTGWALFNVEGAIQRMGEAKYGKPLKQMLFDTVPDYIVVEQFRVRTRRAGEANKMRYVKEFDEVPAARAIGFIESRAIELGLEVYFQEPNVMESASKMFGLPLNRSHQLNAALHGLFWLHKWRRLTPKDRLVVPVTDPVTRDTTIITLKEGDSLAKALKRKR